MTTSPAHDGDDPTSAARLQQHADMTSSPDVRVGVVFCLDKVGAEFLRRTCIASFWRGFLRGLASPVELFSSARIRLPYGSDAEALGEDWENIGQDFRAAMSHERNDAPAGNS